MNILFSTKPIFHLPSIEDNNPNIVHRQIPLYLIYWIMQNLLSTRSNIQTANKFCTCKQHIKCCCILKLYLMSLTFNWGYGTWLVYYIVCVQATILSRNEHFGLWRWEVNALCKSVNYMYLLAWTLLLQFCPLICTPVQDQCTNNMMPLVGADSDTLWYMLRRSSFLLLLLYCTS